MTLALSTYRLATRLARPLLPLWLQRRADAGKELPWRKGERLGTEWEADRPEGKLLWLHGASLGETGALMPILERVLEETDASVLVTYQTVSAANSVASRLGDNPRCRFSFAPLDTPASVRGFFDHWKPDAAVFAESEIWPNLVMEMSRRGIPAALVNARMNADSLARWAKRGASARKLFAGFDPILAADSSTAEGLSTVLGREVELVGNAKFAALPPPAEPEAVAELKARLAGRTVVAALSVHPEEVATFRALAEGLPEEAILLLYPRYPERMPEYGIDDSVPSNVVHIPVEAHHKMYLHIAFGDTALVCAASDCAVMGGSFDASLKGHNPIEPLSLGVPTVSGPHVASFADVFADWYAEIEVEDPMQRLRAWLEDGELRARDANAGLAFAQERAGVLDTVMDRLASQLEALW